MIKEGGRDTQAELMVTCKAAVNSFYYAQCDTAGGGKQASCKMIYCFYLFDRDGVCLYYEDWHRVRSGRMSDGSPVKRHSASLVIFHSCSHGTVCAMRPGGDGKLTADGLQSYNTSTYKLHYYETPTGLRFILITDPLVP
eukprot:754698-Hanusia_phi.AAC.1